MAWWGWIIVAWLAVMFIGIMLFSGPDSIVSRRRRKSRRPGYIFDQGSHHYQKGSHRS